MGTRTMSQNVPISLENTTTRYCTVQRAGFVHKTHEREITQQKLDVHLKKEKNIPHRYLEHEEQGGMKVTKVHRIVSF